MGEVHRLLEEHGKQGALAAAFPRDVIEAASAYMADEDNALAFAYSGWAQCALPHRRTPPGQPWEVLSDRVALLIEPGRRNTAGPGEKPQWETVSVPFGAHARLILIYLQTQALRTNNRVVELGGSWREWMGRIGVPWGGKSGRSVREQAELLSRARMSFHFAGDGHTGLVNQSIVDGALFMEVDDNARQGRLSLEVAKLSEGFFEALKRRPIPIEEAAIRALNNNSAALDVYIWLAYRLHSLKGPKLVTWPALKAQHGASYGKLKHFKERFLDTLAIATAVYPDAQIEVSEKGLLMKPSRPPVPRLVQS